MRMCDGVLLVVDVVEGVMVSTEKAVRQAMQENLPICLLISKVLWHLDVPCLKFLFSTCGRVLPRSQCAHLCSRQCPFLMHSS